jgi:hypothetical protein
MREGELGPAREQEWKPALQAVRVRPPWEADSLRPEAPQAVTFAALAAQPESALTWAAAGARLAQAE